MRTGLLVGAAILALGALVTVGSRAAAQPPTPTRPPFPPTPTQATAPPFIPPSPTPMPSTDLSLPLPGSVTLPPFGRATFRGPERIPLPPTPELGQTPIPVRPLPPVIVEVRSFADQPAFLVVAEGGATISVAEGLAIQATSWSPAPMPCDIMDGLPHAVRCRVDTGRVPTLIQFTAVVAPPPPGTVPIPGSAAIPPRAAVRFFGRPPVPGAGVTYNVEVVSETDQPATATYDGMALTLEVPAGFAVQLTAVTASGVDVCPTQSSTPERLTCRLFPHPPARVVFTAIPVPSDGFTEAALDLTSPCIPEFGRRWCDGFRLRLWRGEAEAWASLRGVSDPEARFTETVLMRVQAGDPAAIGALARILGWPYVKVTRIRFLSNEFVEVTNLGGGGQDLTGWQLRAGPYGRSFSLPTGVILGPGERCTLYNGPALNPGVHSGIFGGDCEATTATTRYPAQGWWPDAGGPVELYDSALDIVADAPLYDADPNRPPPPPNLQLVDVMSCPGQPPALGVAQPGEGRTPTTPPPRSPPTTQPGRDPVPPETAPTVVMPPPRC
jgi:hypothetical protein